MRKWVFHFRRWTSCFQGADNIREGCWEICFLLKKGEKSFFRSGDLCVEISFEFFLMNLLSPLSARRHVALDREIWEQ